MTKFPGNFRGIIFDFDGTLFDSALLPFYLIAANPLDWLRLWRERLIRRRFKGCDYNTSEEYFKAFFEAFGKACFRSPERMRKWYFSHYMPRMVKVLKRYYKPRPGTKELIEHFKTLPFLKLAIYSDYPFSKERLEALDLNPGPGVRLYGPESFGAQKPAVRPFLCIAKDLGVAPDEVLVIGDREDTDGLGAFRAGMRFFCLETGRRRYFRLDPYRNPVKEEPHGPSLVMYAGAWGDLVKQLLNYAQTDEALLEKLKEPLKEQACL